jgi:hypothetical protein
VGGGRILASLGFAKIETYLRVGFGGFVGVFVGVAMRA